LCHLRCERSNNDFDTVLRAQAVELTLAGRKAQEITDKVGRIAYSTYAFAANRVSHTLGLVGASVSVDTASASALVATHMATQEARKTAAGVRALSAGVNLVLHPALTDLHTARKMFPKDGRCKTFDAAADGFERGEGSAAVCQRLLDEAQAAQDIILAVVCGSTTIHKGGGASLRAMRGPAIQHKYAA
jgi:acyl transferase domain-containing protein